MADPETILLVEDDPDIREIVALSLEALGGFSVVSCSDGEEALRELRHCRPDLVLLDWMMPGMNGGETLAAMRREELLGDTPVAFMTAKTRPHEVERIMELGACAVITKPFDPTALARQVRGLIGQAEGGFGEPG
ncbi:response regulator [Silicimonas algicola]|uniref:Response regulator receiver domain-containing protein n=1 Tax=Silicimonas algicola TaxID=1826607 RepID=A0A316G215_9RHOB|nr:response regulator [Silicimonas algicola]AZQ69203.1 response regulator [Silicimonas algicola]PWK54984.1 response regulator receiver domain-containing protein [Silicimonas algicola]